MATYRFCGHGITNNNGIATLDYDANGNPLQNSGLVGTGVGELDIVASLDDPNSISDSSLQSETYSIIDATFVDNGVSTDHNDTGWNKTNLPDTLDRTDGTKIEQVDTSTGAFYYRSQSTTDNICIEFDAYLTTNGVAFFSFRQNSTNVKAIYGTQLADYEANAWNHIKLEVKNGNYYLNGSTTGVSLSTWNRLFLSAYNGYYMKYKNFVIYPI